jgi:type VI secretion system protein ImpC
MARSTLAAVHLDVLEEQKPAALGEPDSPFRILVVGDFSGGASRIRKPVEIDRDNFEKVLALFGPELSLPFAKTKLSVRFNELDDFHPDRLYQQLPPFQALRDLRERIIAGTETPSESPRALNISGADVLREMIGEPASAAAARSEWDQILHEIVARYAVPKADPRRRDYLAQADAAIAGEMRAVLHQPEFQSLESAWRGVLFLARRLPTGENLKIFLLDMPRTDLISPEGLAVLRRVVADEAAVPWALIAGIYSFGTEHETVLGQIAATARGARAPFIGGVSPELVRLKRGFKKLRRLTDAAWVGLATPRFLLRLPYGSNTVATEEFDFEEMPATPDHERYLWGHPAFACAYLLGKTFSLHGWKMRPGTVNQIEGLPLHVYEEGGESVSKPCAEMLLSDDAADGLLGRGFIPLVSAKDSDSVRITQFQSVADPAAPLAGQWS